MRRAFLLAGIACALGACAGSSGTTGSSGSGNSGTSGGLGSSTSGTTGGTTGGACVTSEFRPCRMDGGACFCGQTCVNDRFFASLISSYLADGVCETPCGGNADCANAASTCQPFGDGGESTCQANVCDGGLGGACLANDGTASGTLGTCVVQSEHGLSLCIPNGTATSCNVDGGVGNDDPLRTGLALALFRQDVSDAPAFCGAGKACFGGDVAPRSNQTIDTCEVLCSTALDGGCGFGNACLVQDPNDTTWGFCAACLPARSTDTCYLDSDCCPGSECAGTCCNAGVFGQSCDFDSDCCKQCIGGFCN